VAAARRKVSSCPWHCPLRFTSGKRCFMAISPRPVFGRTCDDAQTDPITNAFRESLLPSRARIRDCGPRLQSGLLPVTARLCRFPSCEKCAGGITSSGFDIVHICSSDSSSVSCSNHVQQGSRLFSSTSAQATCFFFPVHFAPYIFFGGGRRVSARAWDLPAGRGVMFLSSALFPSQFRRE
jgi:hypothetical protein